MLKSKLKIACVGNMNNNMFSITRHLRYLNYDAKLVLSNEEEHFMPDADSLSEIDQTIIIRCKELSSDISYLDKIKCNQFFSQFDVLIVCGQSIAYIAACGIKIDIIIPYGSDIYEVPFIAEKLEVKGNLTYSERNSILLSKFQKKGIEEASAIFFDATNEEFEKVFIKLKLQGKRYKATVPFIFTPEFNLESEIFKKSTNELADKIKSLKEQGNIVLFNHIRQCWKNPPDQWSYKGNDRIFKALKKFTEENNGVKVVLILFEYGVDVEASKSLIKELGIENNVYWSKLRPRKEILVAINYCDIGIGEIGDYSWLSYGAIYEFLCMQKPVIHYREDSLYEKNYSELYPMFSSKNEKEIVAHLNYYLREPEAFINAGKKAFFWFEQEAVLKPLKFITDIIDSTSKLSKMKRHLNQFDLIKDSFILKFKRKLNFRNT